MLRDFQYLVTKRGAWPLYAVVFITERCPARCGHCLLGDERYDGPELTVDEYERTARTMRSFYFLLLTGGEPFIRPDVPDIVGVFARRCRVGNVGIPTNGAFPDETERAARRMVGDFPRVQFGVDVSFDGIGPAHDASRGAPGLFDSAVETFKRLKTLQERATNLSVNAALTLSKGNAQTVDTTIAWLFKDLGADNVNLLLARGAPRDPASLEVEPEAYRVAAERIQGEMRRRGGGYKGYARAGIINAMRQVRSRIIYRTLLTESFQVPCMAARLGVVIRANGDVASCELRDEPMGALRESDFDFGRIWNNDAANRERHAIFKERCFCTYECFYTLNVLYNARVLPELLNAHMNERRARKHALQTTARLHEQSSRPVVSEI